jgi:hypothetical protein
MVALAVRAYRFTYATEAQLQEGRADPLIARTPPPRAASAPAAATPRGR